MSTPTNHLTPDTAPGVDARLLALAANQYLCLSRQQALDTGASPDLVNRRLRQRRLRRLHPGVYALAASPDPWLQRLWAARLAVGDPVAVSHITAAALHGFPGYPRTDRLELTAPHGTHHRVTGAVVHQISDLLPHHVSDGSPTGPGIPVTTVPRTVADLSASASPARLRSLITELVTVKRLGLVDLGVTLGDVARRGKPGVVKLARVLDGLAGRPVKATAAEVAFHAALAARGVPLPTPQAPLPGRGAVSGVVDGLYGPQRLIVEVDSRRWHGRFRDLSRDRERDAEAARAGYQTLRFLYEQVQSDPDWVAETTLTVLDERSALLGTTSPVVAVGRAS